MIEKLLVWLGAKWVILAIGAGLIALIGVSLYRAANYFDDAGYKRRDLEVEKAMAVIRDNVAKATQTLQANAEDNLRTTNEKLQTVTAERDTALDELRKRPARRPNVNVPTNTGSCEGASGAELSGPDAEFLTREAARANRLRANLEYCYAQYDEAFSAVNK